jgi:small GTP-binding protein
MREGYDQPGAYPILENEADILRVLERAKRDSWTAIALLSARIHPVYLDRLGVRGFPRRAVFLTTIPVRGRTLQELCSNRRLTHVKLSGNGVGDAGAKAIAASLTALTSLDLTANGIGDVGAQAIAGSLTALTSLDLAENEIGAEGAQAIAASLKLLTSLNLAENEVGVAGAQAIATSLTALTSLNLAQNEVGIDGAHAIAASMRALTSLDLSANEIGDTEAQAIAAQLTLLTSLDLTANRIGVEGARAIAESLTSLTSLDLSGNAIGVEGAQAIATSLTLLTSLDLSTNGIGVEGARAIAASLAPLTSLDLSTNRIGVEGAQAIAASLTSLTSLDLSTNGIGDTGAQAIAASLTSLTSLDLSTNGIGDAGARAIAGSLRALARLDLAENEIGDAGAQGIAASLKALTSLNMWSNQVGDAGAQAIAKSLTDLTSLDLSRNRISSATLPWLARLRRLKQLNVSANPFIASKGVLALLDAIIREQSLVARLESLDLTECQDFSEICPRELWEGKDAQALLAAYRRRGDRRPLNELKLLVVGNEAVGKTSLIRYLRESQPRNPGEQKTPGVVLNEKIEVSSWSIANSRVGINIWDFGGQEIMHGTHRYFLTQRSLYLLVLEARREDSQEEALEHWLRVIENRGGGSPVLIVVNKSEKDHVYHPDEQRYRRKYPSVAGFVRTTCNDDDVSRASIQRLREAIVEVIEHDERLRHVRDRIPVAWLDIKNELEELAKRRKTVEYAEYVALCADSGKSAERRVTQGAEQKGLLKLLHDLGVVVAHGLEADASAARRELTLLDPNWLTRAIYMVLNSGQLRAHHGVFQASRLHDFLDPTEYPRERLEFIVDMMQHPDIGLCFALPDQRGSYLVPEALPTTEPDSAWTDEALRFCYTYDLLPSGLIPRLIVEAHGLLSREKPTLWKGGAVFEVGACKALVKADRSKNRVDLSIFGPEYQRREALGIVRDYLRRVHAHYLALGQHPRVPLPDQIEVAVSYEHLLKLEQEEGPAYSWLPEGANRKYSVSELLNGIRGSTDAPVPAAGFQARDRPARTWRTEVIVATMAGVVAIVVAAIGVVPNLLAKPCEEGKSVACERQCERGLDAKKLCSNGQWAVCGCVPRSVSGTPLPSNLVQVPGLVTQTVLPSVSQPSGTASGFPNPAAP